MPASAGVEPRAGDAQRTRLKDLGILRNQKPGHEHFNGSLVIPVFNLAGEVVRDVRTEDHDNLRAGHAGPLCIFPGPHRGVWNEEALIASKDIILCEALIDALTFWCRGLSQRDGQLRRQRLHRRSPRGASRSTARSAFTSPTTATRRATKPPRSWPRS